MPGTYITRLNSADNFLQMEQGFFIHVRKLGEKVKKTISSLFVHGKAVSRK